MKKLIIALLCIAFMSTSCNKSIDVNEVIEDSQSNEQIQKQQAERIVIVRVSHGKKKGKWPNQWCSGDETFRCWRWFPKDELIENEEIYMIDNYMIMEYSNLNPTSTPVVLRIPQYHEYRNESMYFYNYVLNNQGFAVYEPIIIDEPVALDYLHVTTPLMIVPKFYRAIRQESCLILPIELVPYNG